MFQNFHNSIKDKIGKPFENLSTFYVCRTSKDGLKLSREGVYWRYIHDPVFGRFEYPNNEEVSSFFLKPSDFLICLQV